MLFMIRDLQAQIFYTCTFKGFCLLPLLPTLPLTLETCAMWPTEAMEQLMGEKRRGVRERKGIIQHVKAQSWHRS